MIKIPEDVEASIQTSFIDLKFEGEVVGSITIDIRSDMVDELGHPSKWKELLAKHISDEMELVRLVKNVQ